MEVNDIKKIKNKKGFTILELIISMAILSICLPSIINTISFISKSKNFNKTTYLAVLECRNVLEGTKKLVKNYGIDFISKEKNTNIKELLLSVGYEINSNEYYFGISIDGVLNNDFTFKLADNEFVNGNENISFFTGNENMFSRENIEVRNYNLEIDETDEGFNIVENKDNVIIDILPTEVNILIEKDILDESFNIKLNSANLENKKINICNMSEKNIFLKIDSASVHNLKLENVNYSGNGVLIFDTKKETSKEESYVLVVSIFDKEYKLLKRLGTLI